MSAAIDEEERELPMSQIRANIELKLADIELKRQQLRWEPLKVVIASAGTGAALMGAALALMAFVLRHTA